MLRGLLYKMELWGVKDWVFKAQNSLWIEMMPLCEVSAGRSGAGPSPVLVLSSPTSLWQGWCQKQSWRSSPCPILCCPVLQGLCCGSLRAAGGSSCAGDGRWLYGSPLAVPLLQPCAVEFSVLFIAAAFQISSGGKRSRCLSKALIQERKGILIWVYQLGRYLLFTACVTPSVI